MATCLTFGLPHVLVVAALCLCHLLSLATASSLDLVLSSEVGGELRMEEGERRVLPFNYSLDVTGDLNHTLALAICATVDDTSIAWASVSPAAIVPLQQDVQGRFNVTINAVFLGRARLHVHFVVGRTGVHCDQAGDDLQALLTVSMATAEQEQNVSVSGSVGLHSGRTYPLIVVRPPQVIDQVFQIGATILVVIINIGMGAELDIAVVKATLRRPFAPVTGFCSQFIIMPLMAFGLARALELDAGLSLGFLVLGCCPGGSISNSFCYMLGGDVSLSITMTFVSTVAALGMMPLWVYTLGSYVSGLDDFSIPFENIVLSLATLVGAVSVGLLLSIKKPAWARRAVCVSKVTFGVFVCFMLTVGIYANLYLFRLMTGVMMIGAATLPYTGFTLGGLVAILLRLPRKQVITIAIETGIQNTGLAIILLLLTLDHPESDLSIVVPATSAIFTPLPLWIAVAVIKIRQRFCKGGGGEGEEGAEKDAGLGGEEEAGCFLCRLCVSKARGEVPRVGHKGSQAQLKALDDPNLDCGVDNPALDLGDQDKGEGGKRNGSLPRNGFKDGGLRHSGVKVAVTKGQSPREERAENHVRDAEDTVSIGGRSDSSLSAAASFGRGDNIETGV